MAADHIHHLCWPEWERARRESRVAEVYRILDEAVGDAASAARRRRRRAWSSPTTAAAPLDGVVNLNAWLAREGCLTYSRAGDGGRASSAQRLLKSRRLRRKLPARPALRRQAAHARPARARRTQRRGASRSIDWARTRAFSVRHVRQRRDQPPRAREQGIVEPGDEYERAARRGSSSGPRAPRPGRASRSSPPCTGARISIDGPHVEKIPDLIVEFARLRVARQGQPPNTPTEHLGHDPDRPRRGRRLRREPPPRGHRRARPGRRPPTRARLSPPAIEDIAPTVLYLLGEPIPVGHRGTGPLRGIDPELARSAAARVRRCRDRSRSARSTATTKARARSSDRLRALGYLE